MSTSSSDFLTVVVLAGFFGLATAHDSSGAAVTRGATAEPEARVSGGTDVRVRLLESASPARVTIAVEAGSFTFNVSGDLGGAQLAAGGSIEVLAQRRGLRVQAEDGGMATASITLTPEDPGSIFRVVVIDGTSRESRAYHGGLVVRALEDSENPTLLLVNSVPLEEYVAAVVSSEYGLDDIEGTRAMAVLARTYALKSMAEPGAMYDHVDHELSQVYRGLQGLTPEARAAALATAGQVLLYRGGLIEAVYHAESGGHTADNESVWDGRAVPYLRGINDRFANNSPYASWEFVADRRRLLKALTTLAGGRQVDGFRIAARNSDHRVAVVELLTASGPVSATANQFRLAVIGEFGARSLRSTLFDAARRGGSYHFTGSGFGHGVGLSQWGAHEMARRGYAYDEILAYYFRGTELVKLPDLVATPQVMAARSEDAAQQQRRRPSAAPDSLSTSPTAVRNSTKTPQRRRRIGW